MVKQFDVSIPAAAGKIHLGRLFQGPPGLRFQFPQLRVRYIRAARRAEPGIKLSIPAAAGKIHRRGRTGTSVPPLSIPAAAGKIHRIDPDQVPGYTLSIPAAAGKIHSKSALKRGGYALLSIPAAAGKIHSFQLNNFKLQAVFQFPQLRVRYIAKITKAHCISAAQFVQLSVFASFIIEEV